jgi:hypothetical protein
MLYIFEAAGDMLPMHRHADDGHITAVLSGRVRICGAFGAIERAAPAVFYPDREHEITALEPDTRILNIGKVSYAAQERDVAGDDRK